MHRTTFIKKKEGKEGIQRKRETGKRRREGGVEERDESENKIRYTISGLGGECTTSHVVISVSIKKDMYIYKSKNKLTKKK